MIWNDLKNDLAKQDIVFLSQLDVVKNLNNGTFSVNDMSEEAYYKVYGYPSLKLKEKIENEIKDKFNEKSDVLDDFAVKLLTKSDDEVIISKGIKQESFGDVYDEILENSENYDGDSKFNDIDSLKIPNIKFKLKESFEELENKK